MKFRRLTAAKEQPHETAGTRTGLIEGIRRVRKSTLLISAFCSVLACHQSDCKEPQRFAGAAAKTSKNTRDASSKSPAPKPLTAFSDVDWKRTHVLVLNTEADDMHWKNALSAIDAATKNKAGRMSIKGLQRDKKNGSEEYILASQIDSGGIDKLLEKVQDESNLGDTVLIYLTGHKQDHFNPGFSESPLHTFLPARIREYLNERNIVLVSDSEPCKCFIDELTKGNKVSSLTLINPGKTTESAPCGRFMEPFWNAVHGLGSLKGSYLFASKAYQVLNPKAHAAFRQSVALAKDAKSVKDGVVMVTADWCPACRIMEPRFKAANLKIPGSIRFYLTKTGDEKNPTSLPAIFIYKDGKKVARHIGAMGADDFIGWLNKNGALSDDSVDLTDLYRRDKFEIIVFFSNWDGMRSRLGAQKALKVLLGMVQHKDRAVRIRAVEILKEGVTKEDFNKMDK